MAELQLTLRALVAQMQMLIQVCVLSSNLPAIYVHRKVANDGASTDHQLGLCQLPTAGIQIAQNRMFMTY